MSLRSYQPFTEMLRRYVDAVSTPCFGGPASQDAAMAELAATEDALFATAEAYVAGSVSLRLSRLAPVRRAEEQPAGARLKIPGRDGVTEMFDPASGAVTQFCERHRHEYIAGRTCFLCDGEAEKRKIIADSVAEVERSKFERAGSRAEHASARRSARRAEGIPGRITRWLFLFCAVGLLFDVARAVWMHFVH